MTSDCYIKDWNVPTISGYEYALWSSSISSFVGYISDYYYPQSGTVLYIGCSIKPLDNYGAFFLYIDFNISSTSTAICGRLMKLS